MYMKYLTKEELDHIAASLIENPSYETLKNLDIEFESKYNIGGPVVSASTSSKVEPIPSGVNEQVVSSLPPVSEPIVTNGTPLVAEPSITNNTPIQQVLFQPTGYHLF